MGWLVIVCFYWKCREFMNNKTSDKNCCLMLDVGNLNQLGIRTNQALQIKYF